VPAVRTTLERDAAPMLASAPWTRVALVNNAASPGYLGWLRELDPEDHLRVLAVNAVSPTWLMGFFLRNTPQSAALRIVNVSSGAAVRAVAGLGAYSTSKAALRMAGAILGAELEAARGTARERADVAVLTYMPGVVDTDMQRLARSRPAAEFPSLRMFEEFRDRGVMVRADAPAEEIASFVESDGQPFFAEASLT
jgi:benzil reductase ((S)-benzoin forming)